MIKLKIFCGFIILCLLTATATTFAAAQLQATVTPDLVTLGETVVLTLELVNATDADLQGKNAPDIGHLKDLFEIYNQQQSIQQVVVQGQMRAQVSWRYVLEPKKTGVLTIPALSLTTAAGNSYKSQPLPVTVVTTAAGNVKRQDNVHLETLVSNPQPYLHQPVLYTLRLYHRGDLRELQPLPPSEGVIMEKVSDWLHRRQTVNGQAMIVSEINYLLTPIQSGKVELNAGQVKALQPDTRNNSFGSNFFSFNMDYRPITFNSDPLTLEVQPPPTSQRPWLPLQNLKLEQKWESDITQPVQVGVPLIRTLTLTAEGMGAQSLPELEKLVQSSDVRMRSPKPETERKMLPDGKTPVSVITQTVSLIPVKTGTVQLPALRLPWWDVQKKVLQWAELPAQTLQVLPNPNDVATRYAPTPTGSVKENNTKSSQPAPQYIYFSQVQHALFGLSLLALLIALGQSWYNRHRNLIVASATTPTSSRMSDSVFKQRLHAAQDLTAIKQLIQEYAQSRWQLSNNASLQTIAIYIKEQCVGGEPFAELLKELNAAWYGNQQFEIDRWKNNLERQLSHLKEKKRSKEGEEQFNQMARLGPLNPI